MKKKLLNISICISYGRVQRDQIKKQTRLVMNISMPFIYMYNVRVRYLQHARNNAQ